MTDRIHFKLPYKQKTLRFSSALGGDQLFRAVNVFIRMYVEHWSNDLFWNNGHCNVLLESAADLTAAISSSPQQAILLMATTSESRATEVVDDVERCSDDAASPVPLLQIKEQVRNLVDVALQEQWTTGLRAAMSPLFSSQTPQLQPPSEICAAEIAVQLQLLEQRVPFDLHLLLQEVRHWSYLDREELRSGWLQKELMRNANTGTNKDSQTDPLLIASNAVMLAVELSMRNELVSFETDNEEECDTTNKDQQQIFDDWIAQTATTIANKARKRMIYANLYPSPAEFLQQANIKIRSEDATAISEDLEAANALVDKETRIRELLQQLCNVEEPQPVTSKISSQYFSLLGMKTSESKAAGDAPSDLRTSLDASIAAVLRRTVEDLPEELQNDLRAVSRGQLSRLVLRDWVDGLAKRARKEPWSVEDVFKTDKLTMLVDHTLKLDDEMNRRIGDESVQCKSSAEIEHRKQIMVRFDIKRALEKYMSFDKSNAFVKYMLPNPPLQPNLADSEQAQRADGMTTEHSEPNGWNFTSATIADVSSRLRLIRIMDSHSIVGSASADDLLREYADACEEVSDVGPSKDPIMATMIGHLSFDRSIDSREGTSEEHPTPDDCLQCEKDNSEILGEEEIVQTPPPSPTERDAVKSGVSFFSLAQVSTKLGEIWSSARESIFGEDYWIPSDPNEIVFFPQELLRAHKIVYPPEDGAAMIRVVQGSLKNRPGIPLHHVVFTVSQDRNAPTYSIFRTSEVDDAVDLCRRCHECAFLFTRLDKKSDARKHIQELIRKMKAYPLWRMLPIAIACNREDVFTSENLQLMNEGVPGGFKSLVETMTQPEGKCPLHIAIEMHRLKIARRMLEDGCDPGIRDVNGNSALHYASLASVQMIELLWEFESSHCLLNQTNNEGCAPVTLAIRNANPRCLATLMGYGAEMSIRVAGRNALFEVMQSKGKNTDIIKAILDGSPELLQERDASGNTVLHAAISKTSLMGLLFLKATELDLNAKNYAGHAPLHLYSLKGEIGLIITLCSYRCNVDERDSNGNTALHISVSKKDLKVTRLLLCLGADPNVKNSSGDTPRHLAARLKHNDILRSLLLCGAARCEMSKSGCVSGCVNNVMLARIKSGSQLGEDCNSPRTTSMLNGLEDEEAKLLIDNKIRFHTQDIFYKRLFDRLEHLEKMGDKSRNFVNLLSMDGGGIRGLVIIQTLLALEKIMGEPVYPYFDWVAGTSTGALVSTALAQGKTLRECQHIYLSFKDQIFDGWTRPYNSALLEDFMKLHVGKESLAEIKAPRLMISTVKADFFPVKLEFMRNYRLPISNEQNEELGFEDPSAMPTWKALRRTSAAPMFFSPVDDKYIDGGIIANNPTLDLLAEVQLYNGTLQYMNRPEEAVEVGVVLSLGTGQIPLTTMDPLHVELTNPISSAFAFKNISLILVDQVTATEGAPVDRSLSWCNAIGVPFFRLSAPLHKDIGLGTKDDHDVAGMMWDCIEYTHAHKAYLERICKILKKMGKRVDRDCAFSDGKTRSMQTQTSTPSTPLASTDPNPISQQI